MDDPKTEITHSINKKFFIVKKYFHALKYVVINIWGIELLRALQNRERGFDLVILVDKEFQRWEPVDETLGCVTTKIRVLYHWPTDSGNFNLDVNNKTIFWLDRRENFSKNEWHLLKGSPKFPTDKSELKMCLESFPFI